MELCRPFCMTVCLACVLFFRGFQFIFFHIERGGTELRRPRSPDGKPGWSRQCTD